MLRWGHFILFTLSMLEYWANSATDVPDKADEDAEANQDKDQHLENVKLIHRDGSRKLFARILATLSVFVYQGTVFYAQMQLANNLLEKIPGSSKYTMKSIKGNRMIWLVIETACFYLYMVAAMIYIFVR